MNHPQSFKRHYTSMMDNYDAMFEEIVSSCHVDCSSVWDLIEQVKALEDFYGRWGSE